MYISLGDLGLFIVILVAVVVGIYAVITLKNINEVVKSAGRLLEKNADHLTKTLSLLPDTVKNAGALAESAREQIDDIGPAVSSVTSSLAETAASLNEKTVSGVSFIKSAMDVVTIIKEYLASRGKD